MSSGISDGKLGPSLFAIIHAEGQIFLHQYTESIFSVHYAWDLLQLAPDSRCPASPVSAAGPGTTSSLPLGAAPCQAPGSRQVDGASRHPRSQLLLKARLRRAGCSHQEPCPVWKQSPSLGPSSGSDHPHRDFFPPLDQVVISSVPICACCLSSNEISLILFPEETQHSSPSSLHLLRAPGPGPF